jgi:hypothetical protein
LNGRLEIKTGKLPTDTIWRSTTEIRHRAEWFFVAAQITMLANQDSLRRSARLELSAQLPRPDDV